MIATALSWLRIRVIDDPVLAAGRNEESVVTGTVCVCRRVRCEERMINLGPTPGIKQIRVRLRFEFTE